RSLPVGDHGHPDGELAQRRVVAGGGHRSGPVPEREALQDDYVRPIESGDDPERMAKLRKRLRPFMLRRTKDLVAADLPEKQEQVLGVELEAQHRRLYDTVLQRERKQVLGLLGDFEKNRFAIFRSLTLLR